MKTKKINNKRGALAITLAMWYIIIMLTVLTTSTYLLQIEATATGDFLMSTKAYYAAVAGIEWARGQVTPLADNVYTGDVLIGGEDVNLDGTDEFKFYYAVKTFADSPSWTNGSPAISSADLVMLSSAGTIKRASDNSVLSRRVIIATLSGPTVVGWMEQMTGGKDKSQIGW